MNTSVRNLSILVLSLFAVSFWLYTQQTRRGVDLVEGSDFIKGLDIEKVATITLAFGKPAPKGSSAADGAAQTAAKASVVLKRDGERFVLAEQKSYPAATAKVNELMFNIANIEVKKLVNGDPSPEELKAMGLAQQSDNPKGLHVTITGDDGKALMAFKLGKDHKGGGSYLQKDGSPQVYLSKAPVFLAQSFRDFVDWTLLSVKPDQLDRVQQSQPSLTVERLAGKLVLMAADTPLPSKPGKTEEWVQQLSGIDFEDFYPLEDEAVKDLSYDRELALTLTNKMVYQLSLAKAADQDEHFIKLSARVADLPSEVVINPNDDKAKLAEIESMLTAKERAEQINRLRSGWVYKVSKADFDRLIKAKAFFQ